jgi:magnesium transporter
MDLEASLEERVRALLDSDAVDRLALLVTAMRPSEFATMAASLEPDQVARLLALFPDEWLPDYVAELEPEDAADYLQTLPAGEAAEIVAELEPDDAADIVAELDEADAEEILGELEPDDAAELRELIAYPPDTAGGRMTPSFVAIEPDLRADQAITALRKVAEEAETIYYVYVIDRSETLLGVLPLHRLVLSRSDARIRDLMTTSAIKVRADEDQERVARVLTDHNLLAVPVVDDQGRLLGIVTQDDVADVLVEEATEDIERLGGSQPLETPYRLASVGLLVRRRLVWLLMLFLAGAYTGTVLRYFEDVTTNVVALSFFIPLLIGTGGNVGSQTVTTLVRAMAVGEVQLRDVRWVMLKELAVAGTMGTVMAVIAFGRAEMLRVGSDVAIVVALTILAICVWSATVAAVLPLLLRKARVDPAVVSAPLIATLVDGTGLVIYFTIARLVLNV